MNLQALVFLVLLWVIAGLGFFLLVRNNEKFASKNKKFFLAVIVCLALLVPLYAKFAVFGEGFFISSDESILRKEVELIEANPDISQLRHTSGPFFIFYVFFLGKVVGTENSILFIGLINSVLISLAAYLLFKVVTKKEKISIGSAMLAFFSSYFLWPIVEVRPHQIGVVFLLFSIILAIKFFQTGKARYFAGLALMLSVFSFMHILSYLIFLGVFLSITGYFFLIANAKKWLIGAAATLFSLWFLFFFANMAFLNLSDDIRWLFSITIFKGFGEAWNTGVKTFFGATFIPSVFFPAALAFSIVIIGVGIAAFFRKQIGSFLVKSEERIFARKSELFFLLSGISIALIALTVVLNFTEIYYNYSNPVNFFVLQAPNFLIGFAALAGFTEIYKLHEGFGSLKSIALALALLFFANLVFGFFLITGFHNFALRVVQVMIFFLAFFAFYYFSKNFASKKVFYAVIAISLLFPAALISGTRDPSFIKFSASNLEYGEFVETYTGIKWTAEKFSYAGFLLEKDPETTAGTVSRNFAVTDLNFLYYSKQDVFNSDTGKTFRQDLEENSGYDKIYSSKNFLVVRLN